MTVSSRLGGEAGVPERVMAAKREENKDAIDAVLRDRSGDGLTVASLCGDVHYLAFFRNLYSALFMGKEVR